MASLFLSSSVNNLPVASPRNASAHHAVPFHSSALRLQSRCSFSFVSVRRCALPRRLVLRNRTVRRARRLLQVVSMAPEEEKLTRRNPLDFPIEWERPKPGRRPDIFPKFSPMKTPLPPPMPYDPPEEDEDEEEKKEEEEEDPEKEEEDQPDKQQ